ncbi:MAG: O-antigen ligase family protein [Nitrospirota bacterium]
MWNIAKLQTIFCSINSDSRYYNLIGTYLLSIFVFILPFDRFGRIRAIWIGCMILFWIVVWFSSKKRFISAGRLVDASLLFLFLWTVFTIIYAVNIRYSIGELKNEMITHLFLFYFTINIVNSINDVKKILMSLVICSFIFSVYGIIEFFWLSNGILLARNVRIGSFTSDYNYLSTFFVIAFPMILVIALSVDRPLLRLSCIIVSGMALFVLFLTYSRAAWIAVFVELCILGWLKKKWFFFLLLSLFSVSLFLFFTCPPYSKVIQNLIGHYDEGRIMIWKFALSKILEYPITGIGYGRNSFILAFPDNPISLNVYPYKHVHNSFLDTALEIGLPGLILLISTFAALLWSIMKSYNLQKRKFESFFLLGLVMIIAGYIIRVQFDHLYVDAPAKLFWILIGSGVSLIKKRA